VLTRSVHPWMIWDNELTALLILDVDLGRVLCTTDMQPLDWEGDRKYFNTLAKEARQHIENTHEAAYVPDARILVASWPTKEHMRQERGMFTAWYPVSVLRDFDAALVDIKLGNVVYKHRPWQYRYPLRARWISTLRHTRRNLYLCVQNGVGCATHAARGATPPLGAERGDVRGAVLRAACRLGASAALRGPGRARVVAQQGPGRSPAVLRRQVRARCVTRGSHLSWGARCMVWRAGFYTHAPSTNGLYATAPSFRTRRPPIVTVSLMDGALPDSFFAQILTDAFPRWHRTFRLSVAKEVARDAVCAFLHVNGSSYLTPATRVRVLASQFVGDLLAYKRFKNRVQSAGIIVSANTFDPEYSTWGALRVPVTDVRRHVNDAILDKWGTACERLAEEKAVYGDGGTGLLKGPVKTTSGILSHRPLVHNLPVATMADTCEYVHLVLQNMGVIGMRRLRKDARPFDPKNVRVSAPPPLRMCPVERAGVRETA